MAPYHYEAFREVLQTMPGQMLTHYVGNVSSFLAKCVILWLVSTILLISSAVLYFTFHYSMMPTMLLTVPVHFQFSACASGAEAAGCAFPRAQVYLLDGSAAPLLHPHVQYTVALEMDMPESDSNKEAGMFMVQMNLTSFDGDLVGTASRANILYYRSRLHRALRTLLLSPLLIAEYQHEQQRLSTDLFSGYLVHEERPPTSAWLEVRSHKVQLYGARLRVHARLSGLRRLMYQYPLLTGLLGTATTFGSLSLLFLLLWLHSGDLPDLISQLRRASVLLAGQPAPPDLTADAQRSETEAASRKEKSMEDFDKGTPMESLAAERPASSWGSSLLPSAAGWLRGTGAAATKKLE